MGPVLGPAQSRVLCSALRHRHAPAHQWSVCPLALHPWGLEQRSLLHHRAPTRAHVKAHSRKDRARPVSTSRCSGPRSTANRQSSELVNWARCCFPPLATPGRGSSSFPLLAAKTAVEAPLYLTMAGVGAANLAADAAAETGAMRIRSAVRGGYDALVRVSAEGRKWRAPQAAPAPAAARARAASGICRAWWPIEIWQDRARDRPLVLALAVARPYAPGSGALT